MPLRHQKAKAHVFLDVGMEEVVKPTPDSDVRAGAGSKVVITIGPSCAEVDVLERLLRAGVTCARVNLSWGAKEYFAYCLANLAEAMKRTRRLCSVFLDTCGREVVVCRPVEYDELGWPRQTGDTRVTIKQGQHITLTTDPNAKCTGTVFPLSYSGFPGIVSPGHQLQIGRFLATGADGGSLFLDVVGTSETTVSCVAANDATLDGLLTVMICHREDEDFRGDFGLPLFTDKDQECLQYLGSRFEIDFVNLSFCNREEDLYEARAFLDNLGMHQTKIVAKVERKSAVRHFEGIARAADGIIISRGNLGLDFEPEAMALLQKRIISRCNQLGKPVLMTRFVDTMVSTPRPTRAEATDVANAVLDGVDGIVLGAETLRGLHPVLTVETVAKLCHAAERHFDYRTHHDSLMGEAYEEEVGPDQGHNSVSDFGLYQSELHKGSSGLEHSVHTIHKHRMATPDEDGSDAGQGRQNGLSPESSSGAAHAPYVSEFGSLLPRTAGSMQHLNRILLTHAPYMTKLESLASSATRTAEKINAGLIIVMVQSGRTVSLVSKYRPPMPIMAVVVPKLKSTKLGWQLEGKYLARQTCVLRGVVPMLAAPMSEGSEDLINEAVCAAFLQKLVKPLQYVVVLRSVRGNQMVKVVQVSSDGTGIRNMTGQNSSGHEEEPDIISDSSPFGAYVMPTSPSGQVGTPRTLSGRPSPIIAPSLSLSPTHRVVTIGAPSSMLLNPTLSENHDRTERARRSHEGPR